jgi:hypothetical protein
VNNHSCARIADDFLKIWEDTERKLPSFIIAPYGISTTAMRQRSSPPRKAQKLLLWNGKNGGSHTKQHYKNERVGWRFVVAGTCIAVCSSPVVTLGILVANKSLFQ